MPMLKKVTKLLMSLTIGLLLNGAPEVGGLVLPPEQAGLSGGQGSAAKTDIDVAITDTAAIITKKKMDFLGVLSRFNRCISILF